MRWDELSRATLDDIMAWATVQPWCRAMADCRQDAGWHSEGDVWTHTKMVCAQLPQLEGWTALTPHEQKVLIFTALFHDSGKPLSTTAPDSAASKVFASIAERISSDLLPPVDMAGCTARMLADVEEKLGATP